MIHDLVRDLNLSLLNIYDARIFLKFVCEKFVCEPLAFLSSLSFLCHKETVVINDPTVK